MNKIALNSPCPCGSGKKYKRCCNNNKASKLIGLVKEEFANKNFASLEEANAHLKVYYTKINHEPVDSFLGLSPDQMHKILYIPMQPGQGVVNFNGNDLNEIQRVPLVEQSLYFLNKLKIEGELKATQKGNLPRNFVRELYERFFKDDAFFDRTPNMEEDIPNAVRLRAILEISGLIKKRSNKFSLTKKGESYLLTGDLKPMYEELFYTFIHKWNWASLDNYADFNLIQQSVAFNFYLLHIKAQDWILDRELGQYYLEAFPRLVNEAPQRQIWTPEKEIINCFVIRFLERACKPLGLIEYRAEGEKFFERKEFYRVSPFFKNNFSFNIR